VKRRGCPTFARGCLASLGSSTAQRAADHDATATALLRSE